MKRYLTGIDAGAYEHPADRAALAALKKLPGFDRLVGAFINLTSGRSLRLLQLASGVRVSATQLPRVYRLVEEAAAVLDLKEVPETFVVQSPMFNAGTYGVERPFITLNSALAATLDDAGLLCVIGHEIGHIKSGHVLYKTLLMILTQMAAGALGNMGGGAAIAAAILALREWDRKSELTGDRAGLLAVQDPATSRKLLMTMAAGSLADAVDHDEFVAQARDYDEGGDILDSVHKIANSLMLTHPFPVVRLRELERWQESGEYARIAGGEYAHAVSTGDEEDEDVFRAAAGSYRKDFDESGDPLAKAAREFGRNIEETARKAGKEVDRFLKSFFS